MNVCKIYWKFILETSNGFKCQFCLDKKTNTRRELQYHIRDEHSNEPDFKKHKTELENNEANSNLVLDIIKEENIDKDVNILDENLSKNTVNPTKKMLIKVTQSEKVLSLFQFLKILIFPFFEFTTLF